MTCDPSRRGAHLRPGAFPLDALEPEVDALIISMTSRE